MTTSAARRAPAREPASLAQCVILAALLHVLVVIVFGTAPGAPVGGGAALLGPLRVTLRAPPAPPVPAPAPPATPAPRTVPALPHAAQPAVPDAPVERIVRPLGSGPSVHESPALPAAPLPEERAPLEPVAPVAALPAAAAAAPASEPAAARAAPAAPPQEAPVAAAPEVPVAADAPEAAASQAVLEPLPATVAQPPQELARPLPLVTPQVVTAPAAVPALPQREVESPAAPAEAAAPAPSAIDKAPDAALPQGPVPGPAAAAPSARPVPDGAVGLDGAPAPATAPAAPPLNLGLPSARGPAGGVSRGVLPLLPAPPERKSKLAEDIEKAAKPDCRNAYRDLGLLAVVPLAKDALKDNGCRW